MRGGWATYTASQTRRDKGEGSIRPETRARPAIPQYPAGETRARAARQRIPLSKAVSGRQYPAGQARDTAVPCSRRGGCATDAAASCPVSRRKTLGPVVRPSPNTWRPCRLSCTECRAWLPCRQHRVPCRLCFHTHLPPAAPTPGCWFGTRASRTRRELRQQVTRADSTGACRPTRPDASSCR